MREEPTSKGQGGINRWDQGVGCLTALRDKETSAVGPSSTDPLESTEAHQMTQFVPDRPAVLRERSWRSVPWDSQTDPFQNDALCHDGVTKRYVDPNHDWCSERSVGRWSWVTRKSMNPSYGQSHAGVTVEDHRDETDSLFGTSDDDVMKGPFKDHVITEILGCARRGVRTSCDWTKTGDNRKVRSSRGRVFPVPSAIGKMDVHPFLVLLLPLHWVSKHGFLTRQNFQLLNVCDKNVPFQIPPATSTNPSNIPGNTFLQIDGVLTGHSQRIVFFHGVNRNHWSFKWFSN